MEVCDREVRTRGRLIRTGFIDGEGYQFFEDPEIALGALRESGARIDLFTFIQRLSDTLPKYNYPMEWDNMATLRVSSFDDWITRQVNNKVRNMIRKAAKNGVVVREVPFDDDLSRSIHAIYNESPIRQGKRFWHDGKDLEAMRKMNGTLTEPSSSVRSSTKA